jgi:hypothetical protein
MIASALLWLGVVTAVVAIASLALPRVRRNARRRLTVAIAALGGIALALVAAALPSRDVLAHVPAREALDSVVPRYQFRERHAIAIAAPPMTVDSAMRRVTPDEIRFYRTLTWLRRFGRCGPESLLDAPRGVPMLALATRTGFRAVVDEPGRELVLRAVGPTARADSLRRCERCVDGLATVALSFTIVPDDDGGSVLTTETRVWASDAPTRRKLAAYWRIILPGSALIRRGWLDAIGRRAERR